MRCKNCGWDNSNNNAKCEKCNAPLTGSMVEPDDFRSPEISPSEKFDPKKTAEGCVECGYPIRTGEKSCPNCGHVLGSEKQVSEKPEHITPGKNESAPDPPKQSGKTCSACHTEISENARFCPGCGNPLTAKENMVPKGGTINPWASVEKMSECSLTFISREGEQEDNTPLRFTGTEIQLNRDNTEPNNLSITSKVQAELSFENGAWYVRDKSTLKTTYIYAGDKKELKQGDIIVLGNRLFKFNF